jgi:hypothetical protein
MKIFAIVLLCLMLVGCSTLNPKVIKWDAENYQANKDLAIALAKTQSLNSGFVAGLGLVDQVKFPITSSGQLRAIIDNPALAIALNDIDETVKKLGYWNDTDYDLGFYLGSRVRAGSQAVIQFVKDFFPQLMSYAPALFAL